MAALPVQEGLIAVNYAARALGISRHMRVQEARQTFPELRCIHGQTIGKPQPIATANTWAHVSAGMLPKGRDNVGILALLYMPLMHK